VDAEFDRPTGVTADVFSHYVALISGLQIVTDVTDMGTKSTSQQAAAADESDIKHDEHNTLPVNDAPCVAGTSCITSRESL